MRELILFLGIISFFIILDAIILARVLLQYKRNDDPIKSIKPWIIRNNERLERNKKMEQLG